MIQPTRDVVVDVVADIICPWCYVGRARLAAAAAMLDGELRLHLRHHPFELNPDMPEAGMSRRDYRTRKFGSWARSLELDARLAHVAADDGLPLNLERQARTPSSFRAHRLVLRHGGEAAEGSLLDALYGAYFVEGRDIGAIETLVDLAVAVGLDGAATAAFLEGDEFGADVRSAVDAAYAAGIDGVPAVVAGGRLVAAGAEPAAVLAERLRTIAAAAA